MNLLSLRSYTVALFNKAAKELFPQARLVSSEVSEIGFTSKFLCPQPLGPDTLSLFEEKMRGWVKAPPAFRLQEMIPSNAARLFRDKGEPELEARALEWQSESEEELIPVVCLDGSYDIAVLPIEPFEKFAFKILDIRKDEGCVTAFGTAFSEKELLKKFVKELKEYEKLEWQRSGVDGAYLVVSRDGQPLFLPRGVEIQEHLRSRFKKLISHEGQSVKIREVKTPDSWSRPLVEAHAEIWMAHARGPIAEWGRTGRGVLHDFCLTVDGEKVVRSSLQFIIETARILGFEYHGILSGLLPPKFENSKVVKEQWKTCAAILRAAVEAENIAFDPEEGRSLGRGPEFSIRLYDALGRTFEGPKVSIDCLTGKILNSLDEPSLAGRVIVETELYPDFDGLTLKLIERGHVSLQNTIKELGR